MAHVDKCCGVCGEYIELKVIGKEWSKWLKEPMERYKRFEMGNVCEGCISKGVQHLHVASLKLSVYKHKEDVSFSKKQKHWFGEGGKKYSTTNGRIYYTCPSLDAQNRKLCVGQPRPQWYNVYTKEDSEFQGGVSANCKFKLRRLLRKLGIRGNIRHLIK